MSLPGQPDRGRQTELTHLASGTTGIAFPPRLCFSHIWVWPPAEWERDLSTGCSLEKAGKASWLRHAEVKGPLALPMAAQTPYTVLPGRGGSHFP